MNRIARGYDARFEVLLRRVGARKPEKGRNWLFARARRLAAALGISESAALTQVHDRLAGRARYRRREKPPALFLCDGGLGGLARWIRAGGYEADWEPGVADAELLRKAQEREATLLTTDSMLMERRLLRDGLVDALWLPPTLPLVEQLAAVFREFGLQLGQPRCMECGGSLEDADKETEHSRIPPRTYRWLDTYFVCSRCNKLFWHGTHWERIKRALAWASGNGEG